MSNTSSSKVLTFKAKRQILHKYTKKAKIFFTILLFGMVKKRSNGFLLKMLQTRYTRNINFFRTTFSIKTFSTFVHEFSIDYIRSNQVCFSNENIQVSALKFSFQSSFLCSALDKVLQSSSYCDIPYQKFEIVAFIIQSLLYVLSGNNDKHYFRNKLLMKQFCETKMMPNFKLESQ